jgi:hypothetical protein
MLSTERLKLPQHQNYHKGKQTMPASTPLPTPSPDEVIISLKTFRQELDAKLQGMKELQRRNVPLIGRSLALSITHLEDSIMRLGMCLKDLNTPNPYPNSYNPTNTIIEPTADGLKL